MIIDLEKLKKEATECGDTENSLFDEVIQIFQKNANDYEKLFFELDEYLDGIIQTGYDDGYENGYQDGLDD